MIDWDDMRYLLAVARQRTLIQAGRELGVNQTTVGRRIDALEKSFGTRLFDHIDQRWVPTAEGIVAIRHAERIEAEVLATATEIAGADQDLSGTVRLTSVSMVLNSVLAPRVKDFYLQYPQIQLELIDSQQNLDLAHLEADIALRLARPDIPSAIASRVGEINFRVYVARQFADRADELPWILFSDFKDHLPEAQWLAMQDHAIAPYARVSDATLMMSVMLNSPCRALLPSVKVTGEMNLVMVGGAEPVVKREVWLVYMKALRRNARIAALARWATEICKSVLV